MMARNAKNGWIGLAALAALAVALPGCSYTDEWFSAPNVYRPPIKDLPRNPPRPAGATVDEEKPSNLASVPERPEPGSTPAQRRAVESGLVGDRDNARYTDEQLRGRPPTPSTSAATAPRVPAPPAAAAPSPAPSSGVPAAAPIAPVLRTEVAPPAPAPTPLPTASARVVPSIVQAPGAPPATPLAVAPIPAAPMPAAPIMTAAFVPPTALPSRPMTAQEVFQAQLQASGARTLSGTPYVQVGAPAAPAPPMVAIAPSRPQQLATGAPTALAGGGTYAQPTMVAATGTAVASAMAPGPASALSIPFQGRAGAVAFTANSAKLGGDADYLLSQVAARVVETGARVRVIGFAPPEKIRGTAAQQKIGAFNLAAERAEAVGRELVRRGVNPRLLTVEGRAEANMAQGAPAARSAEIVLEN